MSTLKFIPNSDADKCIWLNNFTTKLAVHATLLGITPAELTSVQKDNAAFQYMVGMIETYRQFISNLTGYKNMMKHAVGNQHIAGIPVLPTLVAPPPSVPEGVFDRVSLLVGRFKKNDRLH